MCHLSFVLGFNDIHSFVIRTIWCHPMYVFQSILLVVSFTTKKVRIKNKSMDFRHLPVMWHFQLIHNTFLKQISFFLPSPYFSNTFSTYKIKIKTVWRAFLFINFKNIRLWAYDTFTHYNVFVSLSCTDSSRNCDSNIYSDHHFRIKSNNQFP